MTRSRRAVLDGVRADRSTHAGLWLDRYLTFQTDEGGNTSSEAKTAKSGLVRDVDEKIRAADDYHEFFARRQRACLLAAPGRAVRHQVFRSLGRTVVGLGGSGVLENGITLEHTWGVPILPGPALKGVAAAAAHKLVVDEAWRKAGDEDGDPGESQATLFGTTEHAGRVTFLDAWWLPTQADGSLPLHADVITVHNRKYYQGGYSDQSPPDGTDSPIPVSFLSASGSFLVVLEAAEEHAEWLEAAMQLVELGLLHLGIGAKTNAGYGRMKPDEETAAKLEKQARAEVERERRRREDARIPELAATERQRILVGRLSETELYGRVVGVLEKDEPAWEGLDGDSDGQKEAEKEAFRKAAAETDFVQHWKQGASADPEIQAGPKKLQERAQMILGFSDEDKTDEPETDPRLAGLPEGIIAVLQGIGGSKHELWQALATANRDNWPKEGWAALYRIADEDVLTAGNRKRKDVKKLEQMRKKGGL